MRQVFLHTEFEECINQFIDASLGLEKSLSLHIGGCCDNFIVAVNNRGIGVTGGMDCATSFDFSGGIAVMPDG